MNTTQEQIDLDNAACRLSRELDWHDQATLDHNGEYRTRKDADKARRLRERLATLDAKLQEQDCPTMSGTASRYVANGMEVSIDWDQNPTPDDCTLLANVVTEHGSQIHRLTIAEASHVAGIAKDHAEYARIYHDMIS